MRRNVYLLANARTSIAAMLLLLFRTSLAADPTWGSVPIQAPQYFWPRIGDAPSFEWHYAQVHFGDPPQAQNISIDLQNSLTYVYLPNCTYCPVYNNYDQTLSKTVKVEDAYWDLPGYQAFRATEAVRFGGSVVSQDSPIGLVDYMRETLDDRPREGRLGLLGHSADSSRLNRSVLQKLHKSGQLLNPVIGLKLGGSNPKLSVGALDPSDYEGEINWVEVVPPSSSMTFETAIPIEAIRGWQGNILALQYPVSAALSSNTKYIHLPDPFAYLGNPNLLGPQATFFRHPTNAYFWGLNCTVSAKSLDFSTINVPFSVDINGVNYPVNSNDLVQPEASGSLTKFCDVGFLQSTNTSQIANVTLGLPFLRSVYLAYRFPTDDCPTAHYGFAFPKGLGRDSSTISQKPRSPPQYSSQCLQLKAPTPTPTAAVTAIVKPDDEPLQTAKPGEKTWKIYGESSDEQIVLRGIDELPWMVERSGFNASATP